MIRLKLRAGWVPAAAAALVFQTPSPPAAAAQGPEQAQIALSKVPDRVFSGRRSRDVLAAQVMLDRARFSPGEIDGLAGGNTSRAVRAYQTAQGLTPDGKVSTALLKRLEQDHGGSAFRT